MKLLIDIDCLLDTRLGVAYSLGGNKAVEDLFEAKYQNRISDEFGDLTDTFTNEQFKEAYVNRTADILPYSTPTSMYTNLYDMTIAVLLNNLEGSPDAKAIEVVLNTQHYKLNEKERNDLKEVIDKYVAPQTKSSVTAYEEGTLTPEMLRSLGVDIYYTYSFDEWCSTIFKPDDKGDPVKIVPAPEIKIYFAALTKSKAELDAHYREAQGHVSLTDPFELSKVVMADIIGVNYFDSSMYSMFTKEDLEATEHNGRG